MGTSTSTGSAASGAIILGYCDPVVDDAVREQIGKGVATSISSAVELELAEELCRTIPCAEMVRYAKCGGEACAIAVRIARGATGRDKVLFCGYHGWHDWYLAANLVAEESLNSHLFPGIEPIGVPKALAGTALPFPFGDLARWDSCSMTTKARSRRSSWNRSVRNGRPTGILPAFASCATNAAWC